MPYRFTTDDATVEAGVRRIAAEQIDRAIDEIDDPKIDRRTAVHQVRKRMKKLRGLIRLVRPGFPAHAEENAALRDAARRLSGLRDRDVLLATHDALVASAGLDSAEIAPVRAHLAASGPCEAPEAAEAPIAAFREDLLALRERAAGWRIEGNGGKALREGMIKVVSRARKAMAEAEHTLHDEDLHDWRKRAKYHWYHARLLSAINPDPMKSRARLARGLSEDLGDHHDLSVYRAALAGAAPGADDAPMFHAMARHALARQKELEDAALGKGHELFDEKPKRLRKRWSGWWQDWRKAA